MDTRGMTRVAAPVDAGDVLATLAAFWAAPEPCEVTGRMPQRIAGSKWDQAVPEGAENPYWEIVRQMPLSEIGNPWAGGRPEPEGYWLGRKTYHLVSRHELCATFAWSIPSPGDIAWIGARLNGRGLVEPGAGGGYWAWQLRQAGVDVVAYEPSDPAENRFARRTEPWSPVLRADHDAAKAHPDRAMLLCWPSYDEPWAAWSLAAYRGDQLFYIGEPEGGCCADDEFFKLLDAEWKEAGDCGLHVSWMGIHCHLTEYRRKA